MHELDTLAVAGGDYCVGRWPGAGEPVLAVHGITSNHLAWARIVRALNSDFNVYAPDLRGRGNNAKLPPPYGFDAHVADLLALLDHYELPSVVYVGHSLGAYIGLDLAIAAPERIRGLVLVDGGIALPLREGKRPEDVIKGVLGPALARLDNVYPDRESYHEFWRTHPAFQDPDGFNDDVVAFADYDLVGEPPAMRSGINADADLAAHRAARPDEPAAAAVATGCRRRKRRRERAPRGQRNRRHEPLQHHARCRCRSGCGSH